MPRVIITMPKKMHDALKRVSEDTNAPVAALIREAVEEWAQRRDIKVEDTVSWGGPREAKKEGTDQGERVAVARGVT